ncbi:hypothetical protein Tco_0790075 [Tanacetum coccineum]
MASVSKLFSGGCQSERLPNVIISGNWDSGANTFTKGLLSTGAKGLSSMIVDKLKRPFCELEIVIAKDVGDELERCILIMGS